MQELNPTNEADLFDRHDHRAARGAKQGIVLPHIFAVFGVVRGADIKAKIWVRMWLPYKFSTVVRRARGARTDTSKIEITKHTLNTANNNRILAAVIPDLQDAT